MSRSGAGVQDPPGAEQGVAGAAAAPARDLLDPAAALIEGVTGEADRVERIENRDGVGQFFGGGGLEACEPVHRDDLQPVAPRLGTLGQPGLEDLLGAALHHVQQPRRARPGTHGRQVDDDGDEPRSVASVPPAMLVDPDHLDAVEPVRIVDQDPAALVQHGGVGGAPGHPERLGDPGDGQVLVHDALQRPPQPGPGQLRSRAGGLGDILPPHVPAPAAPVAADDDQQRRGTPSERLVRKPSGHAVPHDALTTAAPAPQIRLLRLGIGGNPARQDRTIGLHMLGDHHKPEVVQAAERGQVRADEGNVGHVEVFRLGGVRTPILGRPRPSSRERRADPATPSSAKSPFALALPEVLSVFVLAGGDDFLIHVAVTDMNALHALLMDQFSTRKEVIGFRTSVIFQHARNQ